MDCMKERRSIRKYKSEMIDEGVVDEIVKAGLIAPSAKNRQPWKYLIYTGDTKAELLGAMEKGLMREKAGQAILPQSAAGLPSAFHTLKIMRQAPVLIIVLNTNGRSPFGEAVADERVTEMNDMLSIGASVEHMLLKATELGIGSLWIGNTCFAYDEIVELIGTKQELAGAISLGYADEKPEARPRKAFDEVVQKF